MKASKSKENATPLQRSRASRPLGRASRSIPLPQEGQWRGEIESLAARKFSSREAAFGAIADAVLDRVASTGANRLEEKAFLLQLLATDYEVCQVVDELVK